ncbi:hypothetical protein CHT76_08455 [Listeria monocytogenes]|nr:hypothetical protein [Listeria monocytogenes]EAG8714033.1 hypothetical protein [Listeria monocytogenes]EAG8732404.1 hypothetical protein [Listeria monocytogenes]
MFVSKKKYDDALREIFNLKFDIEYRQNKLITDDTFHRMLMDGTIVNYFNITNSDIAINHRNKNETPILFVNDKRIENIESIEYIWVTSDSKNEAACYLKVVHYTYKLAFFNNGQCEVVPSQFVRDVIEHYNYAHAKSRQKEVNT